MHPYFGKGKPWRACRSRFPARSRRAGNTRVGAVRARFPWRTLYPNPVLTVGPVAAILTGYTARAGRPDGTLRAGNARVGAILTVGPIRARFPARAWRTLRAGYRFGDRRCRRRGRRLEVGAGCYLPSEHADEKAGGDYRGAGHHENGAGSHLSGTSSAVPSGRVPNVRMDSDLPARRPNKAPKMAEMTDTNDETTADVSTVGVA